MDQKLLVTAQMTESIQFAMQQNYVPVCRSLVFVNQTDAPLSDLTVQITCAPEFASPFTATLESLLPGEPVELSPVRLVLSPEFLFSLTERLVGTVTISVLQGTACLYTTTREVTVLACDQWLGAACMPELLAAFVTPNHPAVTALLQRAGALLEEWTGERAFTGYQTRNPNVAKQQLAALYAAMQAEKIAYMVPPASYEVSGQRIRLPHCVLTQKAATCLDFAVLLASALEAAGLNPLIFLIDGHAFAGCWLEDETFGECVEDDVSAVTKRIAAGIDRICAVECTDAAASRNVAFDKAEGHARNHFQNPEAFHLVLDVARCRCSGIRPIPVQLVAGEQYAAGAAADREAAAAQAPRTLDLSMHTTTDGTPKAVTKQDLWERKLLDLSLKNRLINFRPSASNVQLMSAHLAALEDELSRGEAFRLMPVPTDFTLTVSDSKIFELENDRDLISTIADAEFKQRRLRTFLSPEELERTLKKLHRQAKLSLEENGANTLYLALGLLRWFETEKSERPRYAPLVLVPVDIIRKIQDRSYAVRVRDEETQMNVTLLEMLRQDFGIVIEGLNPLPEDESGVDLPLIFNVVRQAVMAQKHWDVEEAAFLGQFSFSQFMMWNDLRNRAAELRQNKVVASLIAGNMTWTPAAADFSPEALDADCAPSDLAIPMSTDSSQLGAVCQAAAGESFVLHGPPGTGKSQTITNMIANALYHGKSVLFVAEKMAALSVVQKRLESVGLAPFCLELHSNKAQKRAVLQQLERTLAVGHIKSPEAYAAAATRLHTLRGELNATMAAIHKKRGPGLSVYDAVTACETGKALVGRMKLAPDAVMAADAQTYQQWQDAVRAVASAGRACGGLLSSPLRHYGGQKYTRELRDDFRALAARLRDGAKQTQQLANDLSSVLGAPLAGEFEAYGATVALLAGLTDGTPFFADALTDAAFDGLRAPLEALLADGVQLRALERDMDARFDPSVWTYDGAAAARDLKAAQQSWFLPKLLGEKKLLKAMALYAKPGVTITKEQLPALYEQIAAHSRLRERMTGADSRLTGLLGGLWIGLDSDFAALSEALSRTVTLRAQLASLPALREPVGRLLRDNAMREHLTPIAKQAQETFSAVQDCLAQLAEHHTVDTAAVTAQTPWYEAVGVAAAGWHDAADGLKDRTVLAAALAALCDCGLSVVAEAYTAGTLSEDELTPAFTAEVGRALLSGALVQEPLLAQFQGEKFEDTIAKYRETCDSFSQLTMQALSARLSAKIPDTSSAAAGSSELALLQKAIRSGGRMLPIRKLFDGIPTLLRRICPCMLMSPISVAQYIDPSFPKFDLVIFDEASQLPTCEAVGAIARGENVVVVGDPKQLPPTSFFTANQTDEEQVEQEDLESVLDDCLALAMPQRHLLWHYRSRHESLIAYSNAKYYENRLLTFPSPNDRVSAVQWFPVEGFYDKGGTKQCRAEAEAIVAELTRRLSDETLRRESVGVVTFSVVQQVLIDDLLGEAFRRQPELETIANQMYEPIFVKNLENVQGDERDVILFSVGYGPDKDGKVSMNFGPLNRDGGWRRLNVAISRARRGMQVYSVLRPEQIDLSRTRSDGVAGLKGFLEFAAKGKDALPARAEQQVAAQAFPQLVAAALEQRGYAVRCDIGCSAYRVDIGIVHPTRPEAYLLGILCDGAQHFDAATARDSHLLQPQVLRGLGWKLMQVRALDWYDNSRKVLDAICHAAAEALTQAQTPDAPPKLPDPPKQAQPVFEAEEIPSAADKCSVYQPYAPMICGTPEQFYLQAERSTTARFIRSILAQEAPVSRRVLLKYLLAMYGIARSGSRVEKIFAEALALAGTQETQAGTFLWTREQNPAQYALCRRSASEETRRSAEDICAQELANGAVLILTDQIRMQRSDLIHETARLFGFSRSGGAMEAAMTEAIALAEADGRIVCAPDGQIALKEQ